MYTQLAKMHVKPKPFEFYTTETLWNDPHISKMMLAAHLNEDLDRASRRKSFISQSVAWMADHFHLGTGTRICDFGCGPGLYTLEFARLGADVTGVDFSQRSIAYARQAAATAGVSVRYLLENYLQYETDEKFDLITMIMCDFCVLSPQQRKAFLQKCRRLLKEDGALVFDGYLLPAFEKSSESVLFQRRLMDGFWSEDDYFGFMHTYRYPAENVTLDQYTIIQKDRTWSVYNWLQYYSLETLTELVESCGLRIHEKYSDVAGSAFSADADEFAVVVKFSS